MKSSRSKAVKPSEIYPKPSFDGTLLCQCGGVLMTERTEHGHLWDRHWVYRVRCPWCPMSTRWMCSEYDALLELFEGMEKRRLLSRGKKNKP